MPPELICQAEVYDPAHHVSRNSEHDSILTFQNGYPDIRLEYTSTRHRFIRSYPKRLSVRFCPFREQTPLTVCGRQPGRAATMPAATKLLTLHVITHRHPCQLTFCRLACDKDIKFRPSESPPAAAWGGVGRAASRPQLCRGMRLCRHARRPVYSTPAPKSTDALLLRAYHHWTMRT